MKRYAITWMLALIVSRVALADVDPQGPAVTGQAADTAEFQRTVAPFLKMYCSDCHGQEKPKAGLALVKLNPDLLRGPDSDSWHEILNKLQLGEMPPKDGPRPPQDKLLQVTNWLNRELEKSRQVERNVGRNILLRRLNRAEYSNTIRDLIGLPIDAAEHFTEDTRTAGFDTVAAGLTISPLHVENYLEAAQHVLDLAIVSGDAPLKQHFRIEYLGEKGRVLLKDPRGNGKGDIRGGDNKLDFQPRVKPGWFAGKNQIFDYNGKTFYKELETVGAPPPLHHDVIDLTTDPAQRLHRFADTLFGGETAARYKNAEITGHSTLKFRMFNYDAGVYRLRLRASAILPVGWKGPLPVMQVFLEPERRLVRTVEVSPEPQEIELTVYRETIPTYQSRFNQRSWGLKLEFPHRTMLAPELAVEYLELVDRNGHLFWPPGKEPAIYADLVRKLKDGEQLELKTQRPPNLLPEVVEVPVGVHVESVEVEGPYLSQWQPEYHERILFNSPRSNDEPAYAREVLQRFATRAFRRPVRDEEIDAMFALYEKRRTAGGTFQDAIKVPLTAILVSPHFLYVVKPSAPDAGPRRLSDYELASRLSYFLWSTMPDDELLQLAANGRIREEQVLRQQVQRMIADDRSNALVENFCGQWLHLRHLDTLQPDATLYPRFNEGLRTAMIAETQKFFAEVLHKNLSVTNFIDSDWAMLNQTMASHYGISGVQGPEFRRVGLPPEAHRGGLLTQASILTATSNGIRTLPVHRGIFVLEEFWADPPPPPPPNAGQLEDTAPEAENLNVRERLAQHRRNPACSACHQKIDPLGFALESYDVIGRWRERERLLVEDQKEKNGKMFMVPRVVLGAGVETAAQLADGRKFADIQQFKAILLAEQGRFVASLIEKLLVYSLGRNVNFADRPLIDSLREQSAKSDHRIQSMIENIVGSDAFCWE